MSLNGKDYLASRQLAESIWPSTAIVLADKKGVDLLKAIESTYRTK